MAAGECNGETSCILEASDAMFGTSGCTDDDGVAYLEVIYECGTFLFLCDFGFSCLLLLQCVFVSFRSTYEHPVLMSSFCTVCLSILYLMEE